MHFLPFTPHCSRQPLSGTKKTPGFFTERQEIYIWNDIFIRILMAAYTSFPSWATRKAYLCTVRSSVKCLILLLLLLCIDIRASIVGGYFCSSVCCHNCYCVLSSLAHPSALLRLLHTVGAFHSSFLCVGRGAVWRIHMTNFQVHTSSPHKKGWKKGK